MKIKNFNEIYENMIRQKNPMVDKLQRNKQISAIAFFALVILLFFAYGFIAKNTVVFVIILVSIVSITSLILSFLDDSTLIYFSKLSIFYIRMDVLSGLS